MINKLSVIILTYNESIHIQRAIENVKDCCAEVIVLDSYSADDTVKIAEEFGAKVFQRKFDNYAAQRNYAITELPIANEWILFLDADEYLSEELKKEIATELKSPKADGYYIKRRFYFMGKWIKWGGYYPTYLLRLFKKEKGLFQREINEHLFLNGISKKLQFDFCDDNKKSFTEWWLKHLKYAEREAFDLYNENKLSKDIKFWGSQAERTSWIRYKIWNKIPLLIRPFIYFFYRYFLRLGFLDGRTGFIFHFMHGLVYYLMIDNFYLELKKNIK